MLRTSCTTSSPDAGGGWFALTTNADPDKQSLGDLVPAVQTALIGLLDDADELEGAFQEAHSYRGPCPTKSARRS